MAKFGHWMPEKNCGSLVSTACLEAARQELCPCGLQGVKEISEDVFERSAILVKSYSEMEYIGLACPEGYPPHQAVNFAYECRKLVSLVSDSWTKSINWTQCGTRLSPFPTSIS
jgi:hypothetical protein